MTKKELARTIFLARKKANIKAKEGHSEEMIAISLKFLFKGLSREICEKIAKEEIEKEWEDD